MRHTTMLLRQLAVPVPCAYPGMKVADLFDACVKAQMPGLPFRDADGHLSGKASIRHILKMTALPDYLVKHAELLGDDIRHLRLPEIHCAEILNRTIDDFILPQLPSINPGAPVSKALAVMEQQDTTYIFVMEGDECFGAISIMSLAQQMLSHECRQ